MRWRPERVAGAASQPAAGAAVEEKRLTEIDHLTDLREDAFALAACCLRLRGEPDGPP